MKKLTLPKVKMPKIDTKKIKAKAELGMKNLRRTLRKNGPQLKIGGGIALMASAVVINGYAAKNAEKMVKEKSEELGRDLTKKEKIFTIGKAHRLPIAMTLGGSGLIWSGTSDMAKNYRTLAGRYNSIRTYNTFKDVVRDGISDAAVKEIGDKISGEEEKTVEPTAPRPYYMPAGKVLFKEDLGGKFFWISPDRLETVMRQFNGELGSARNATGCLTLSDLYERLGVMPTTFSDSRYWTSTEGEIRYRTYRTDRTTEYDIGLPVGIPYRILEFITPPYVDICTNNRRIW